jgi:hypothetical protein
MIKNKVFILGDSCTTNLAGEYIWNNMPKLGIKNFIIDNIEFIFVWSTGKSAYSMTKNGFNEIMDFIKINNKTIEENDIVILHFGGIDYEFYFPFRNNLEKTINDYCEYSIKYFSQYTKNISFFGLYPPARHMADEANKKNRTTADYELRFNCWLNTNNVFNIKSKEYNLPTPLSIAYDIFKQDEKILGIHTYDGMHLIDHVAIKVRKDLVQWIKETYKNILIK